MGIEIDFGTFRDMVETLLGFSIPDWAWVILIAAPGVVGFIVTGWFVVKGVFKIGSRIISSMRPREAKLAQEDFLRIRTWFVQHLISEVERLNRETDWNDILYTELEAEVEVDPYEPLEQQHGHFMIVYAHSLWTSIKNLLRLNTSKRVPSLVEAIQRAKGRAFLVIGDPGSGKTVSFRRLFLVMAKRCAASKKPGEIVPLYLNLKRLDIPAEQIDADKIHTWIEEELRLGQDRTIHDILDKNFRSMLDKGQFFFIFDSFDEIPAVMDAREDETPVRQFAYALDRFLHAGHGCRGLVSSRSYRAPTVFNAQRMSIQPLDGKRINQTLKNYLIQQGQLARRLWDELLKERSDLLYVARNPFYLSLLARYAREQERLPDRQYDLFEHFVESRAHTDENRLHAFQLTPEQLLGEASILAFAMSNAPHLGLEATREQIETAVRDLVGNEPVPSPAQLQKLTEALHFSKLLQRTQETTATPAIYGFVHRRFHEYFAARYLRDHVGAAPVHAIAADNRWREVLVLLCEVAPVEHLEPIFARARTTLHAGNLVSRPSRPAPGSMRLDAVRSRRKTYKKRDDTAHATSLSTKPEHQTAVETLRFLRDGFRSRLDDLPPDVRALCARFMQLQLHYGNLLDQKRVIESLIVADDRTMAHILSKTLMSESRWLRSVSLGACRFLRTLTPDVARTIRHRLLADNKSVVYFRDIPYYQSWLSVPVLLPLLPVVGIMQIWLMFHTRLIPVYFLMWLIFLEIDSILFQGLFFGIITILAMVILLGIALLKTLGFREMVLEDASHHGVEYGLTDCLKNVSGKLITIIIKNSIKEMSFVKNSIKEMSFVKNSIKEMSLMFVGLFYLSPIMLLCGLCSVWFILLLENVGVVSSFSRTPDSEAMVAVRILEQTIAQVPFSGLLRQILAMLPLIALIILLLLRLLKFIANLREGMQQVIANLREGMQQVIANLREGMQPAVDNTRFTMMKIYPEKRPSTTQEALKILKEFQSQVVKQQFVRSLHTWLPVSNEWPLLQEEAMRQEGTLRDELFKLVEYWQDALPE